MKPIISAALAATILFYAVLSASQAERAEYQRQGKGGYPNRSRAVALDFFNTTQGPLWPPSALVDKNGDYVVVGSVISQLAPGVHVPLPNQEALVSRNTIPPLDNSGKEDFSNPLGASYSIIRPLDLSPGSPDLDITLYANSFGPPQGDFGGGPRIPMQGESRYNLNGASVKGNHCAELFPAASQRQSYTRPSFALHRVPVPGFQGDQLAYDVNTGEEFVPRLKNGADCPPEGCLGEDPLHSRRDMAVTLGQWLKAQVRAKVRLIDYNASAGGYTAARFTVAAKDLLPNAIYVIVAIRSSVFEPRPILKAPDPAALNSLLVTEHAGRGRVSFTVPHPFPDPAVDNAGLRIIGLALAYKSDFTVSGACPIRLGPGVDIHAVATTTSNEVATSRLADLITVATPDW